MSSQWQTGGNKNTQVKYTHDQKLTNARISPTETPKYHAISFGVHRMLSNFYQLINPPIVRLVIRDAIALIMTSS